MAPQRFRVLRLGAVAIGMVAASGALLGISSPVGAQTAASVSIVISPEVPAGASISTLPTNVGQRLFVQVTNNGSVALTNQQFVVRLAQKPDLISAVNDGAGNVGLIDAVTGAWYHTIAQLPPGVTFTYSVSALKYCAGRWPIAARVGDKVAVSYASWIGQPDTRCTADETASPATSTYYSLTWPATGVPPIVPPATSTVVPGITTTTTLVPGPTTTTTTILGSVGATTTTTIVGTKPTLINLTLTATTTTTTTIAPSTTTVAGTKASAKGSAPTTTILFCKTVGGKRYCAPKYSVYKPGQKKVVEKKATAANKKKAASSKKK